MYLQGLTNPISRHLGIGRKVPGIVSIGCVLTEGKGVGSVNVKAMSEIQVEETSCLTSNESNGGLSPPPSEASNGGGRGGGARARLARSGSISSSSNPTTTSEEAMHRAVQKSGRYFNPWPTWRFPSLFMFLKFMLCERNNSNVPSRRELDQALPVLVPNKETLNHPPESQPQVTWIGHSTVLLQMDGVNLLTDPVFSQRASPIACLGPKRYRQVPCTIHDLPQIHAVVISHTHYDHLDYSSVQTLNARFGAELRWFVPQGLAQWMHSAGCENVIELGWWDENCIPEKPDVRFVFTPAQHWSGRHPLDNNKALWGSWCVIGPWNKFYFAGDTGYCTVFETIGKKYGPFDLAAIPIGAYEPRWFMKPQHVNPEEAVQIHVDIQAKKSLGIHWGTFVLTNEFYLEPPERTARAMEAKGLNPEDFIVLKHGETTTVGDGANSID